MKLNLGCGSDVRAGYENIDLVNPSNNPLIKIADARTISYENIEEIIAISLVDQIPWEELPSVLNAWRLNLMVGGEVFIQGTDYENFANDIYHGRLTPEQANSVAYGPGVKSMNSLFSMEVLLKQGGFSIMEKGIKSGLYYIRARK